MRQSSASFTAKPASACAAALPGSDLRVPANQAAERSILGSILERPELVRDLIAANLQPADFYLDAHRCIYQRILDLAQSSRPVDEISLAEALQAHQELERVGGRAYLIDLTYLVVPERKHVLYHAGLVMANANLRRIQRIAARAVEAAGVSGADPERLAEEVVRALVQTSGSGKDRHCSEARTAAPEGESS